MAPEQMRGETVDARADVFSFCVALYQAVFGQLPFAGQTLQELERAIAEGPRWPAGTAKVPARLRGILAQGMQADPKSRFSSMEALLQELMPMPSRRRAFAAAGAVVLIACAAAAWLVQRESRIRWAREEALPEIAALAEKMRYPAAFALAERAERIIPSDAALGRLFNEITRTVTVETIPAGAEVFLAEYDSGAFRPLGRSPLSARIPNAPLFGAHRWRVVKEGFAPLEGLTSNGRTASPTWSATQMRFVLDRDPPQGMVRVPGGQVGLQIPGLDHLPPLDLPDYFIDRFEVTNRQFAQFVDAGGYRRRELWKEPFLDGTRTLSFEEAVDRFRDPTGRSVPATWLSGNYPEGQDDFPVTGVSWYEAAAYAQFAGKSLPTVYHWNRAAGTWASAAIIPASNFGGVGLARVGSQREIGPYGTHDMAGNAKEWCWNASGAKRYILGGAWNEPSYMFTEVDAQAPFDRAPTHGFRLVKYLGEEKVPPAATGPVANAHQRDYATEKPVPEAIFEVYRSLYAYDRAELKATVGAVDDSSDRFRKEKVSFAGAYGNERVIAYLFTPRQGRPPYQPIIYFPGTSAIHLRSSDDLPARFFAFLVKSGRAVIFPIYKSTYDRGDALKSYYQEPTRFYRDHVIQWSNDLGRTLDYLESRTDMDHRAVGYLGLSWGAMMAPIMLAVEPRIRAAVLEGGGFMFQKTLPEVDPLNFAPRMRQPALLVTGRYDFFFPVESSQAPFFRLLGAPGQDKRFVVFESGHIPPTDLTMKEILDWFDRYLSPAR
jgi:formylglycine-generating enzyme required for sulfatase activity/dienelactone hydrolase